MKRLFKITGGLAALIVAVLFAAHVVRSLQGYDLSLYATPRAAFAIGLATIIWALTVFLMTLAWRVMLANLGIHRSWRELFGIVGISQFGKYVPGHIAQYAGRAGMSLKRKMPASPVATTMIAENLLLIVTAIMVGVCTGIASHVGLRVIHHHTPQLVLVVALLAVAIVGMLSFRRLAPAILDKFAPHLASAVENARLPDRPSLMRAFCIYCTFQIALGTTLAVLAILLLPGASHDYWLLLAAFALAWVVGFVTPGSPAGLGVREGLLLLMLAPVYTTATAGVLIIALRIATTLGDVLVLVAGIVVLPKPVHAIRNPGP